MLPIPQMNLEILHRHPRARRVEFSRTVTASDSREVLVLEFLAGGGVGVGNGGHGFGIDGGVAHDAFEGVVWISAVKLGEARN